MSLGLGLVSTAVVAPPVIAATIVVDSTADDLDQGNNGNCTLREAVIAANRNEGRDACPPGEAAPVVDEIVVPAGVYLLAIDGPGSQHNPADQGDLNLLEDVDIRGAGQAVTIIDGDFIDRVFEISTFSVTARFFDLTIRRGRADSDRVAGIRSRTARVVLTDCTVTGNDGIGIGHSGFRLELIRTTVADNLDTGVSKATSRVTLIDSVLSGNRSPFQAGGLRLALDAEAILVRTRIEDNSAEADGGGIRVVGSSLSLEDSVIRGNESGGSGGGVFATDSTLHFERSTVAENRATFSGGGLALGQSSVTELVNSTVSGNHAGARAGGLFLSGGEVTATHVTLADNRSGIGGAALRTDSDGGIATFSASLLSGGCALAAGGVISNGGNLESPTDACSLDQPSDRSGLGAGDVALGPLGDYGGLTPTHYLGPTSLALGAAPGAGCPLTDQRGEPRPGPECDAGSVEIQPSENFPLFEDGFETGDADRWDTATG